ncbi:MAG: hypothetical protein R3C16_13535 [Hyphomonadaceae bacterium]
MRITLTALLAGVLLAGCAGLEPVGRNASRGEPAPIPTASRPAPAPAATPAPAPAPAPQQVQAPTPAPTPAPVQRAQTTPPPVAAPNVSVAEAAPPPRPRETAQNDSSVVVPGARQIEPPGGDPRTQSERMRDIRAWDRCVLEVQAVFDRDPMSPQLQSPEELCRAQLGMADRTAVPNRR